MHSLNFSHEVIVYVNGHKHLPQQQSQLQSHTINEGHGASYLMQLFCITSHVCIFFSCSLYVFLLGFFCLFLFSLHVTDFRGQSMDGHFKSA